MYRCENFKKHSLIGHEIFLVLYLTFKWVKTHYTNANTAVLCTNNLQCLMTSSKQIARHKINNNLVHDGFHVLLVQYNVETGHHVCIHSLRTYYGCYIHYDL